MSEKIKAKKIKRKVNKRAVATSICVFFVSYTVLIGFLLVMLLVAHGSNWMHYLDETADTTANLITMCCCTLFLYAIIFIYSLFEDPEFVEHPSNSVLVFCTLTITLMVNYVLGKYVNVYLRPVGLFAMLCVFFFKRRQAVFFNVMFGVIMFTIDIYLREFQAFNPENGPLFSLIVCLVCGTISAFIASKVRTRIGLLLTGVATAVPTIVVVLLLKLPKYIKLGWIQIVSSVGFSALACIIASVLALALLPLLEIAFKRLTVFRLRELTSTSAPLLVRLREEAPGTFNHCLVVAHLAENCAIAIGENAELARAAASYHDVGKLKQPDCFTENQSDYNVHDELMPELSADIIRSHAKDGYNLLKSAHLPDIICDVAREHHGTLPIKYFYAKATKISGVDANIKDYSYLGPTPQSKIAAIVMIADAAEAASRALQNRTPENVERVVRGIIEERMDLDQFTQCDITMKELTIIKQTIVDALTGVHHHRVEYPSISFNREKHAVKEDGSGKEEK